MAYGTRINGWRRLGRDILLKFEEKTATDVDGKTLDHSHSTASVTAYISVPGPTVGYFSNQLSQPIFEIIESICTFALDKPVTIFPVAHWSCTEDEIKEISGKHLSMEVLELARHGISLNIFESLFTIGGNEPFLKLRGALMTFSAALRQERDPVACLLYVISVEALSNPPTAWKFNRITKRFVSFFEDLMPDDIDELLRSTEASGVFNIRINNPPTKANRRKILNKIYAIRSEIAHEGVGFSYFSPVNFEIGADTARRSILKRFAEAAILRFIESPRNCIIGHTAYEKDTLGEQ